MTIDDFIVPKAEWVRIVASTYIPTDNTRAMVGKEYEVASRLYTNGIVSVRAASYLVYFNASDVRTLTPLSFEGKRVAIGDTVIHGTTNFVVYGSFWLDGQMHLCLLREGGSMDGSCYTRREDELTAHRPYLGAQKRTAEEVLSTLSDADREIVAEWVKGRK